MKKILFITSMLFIVNAQASIEHDSNYVAPNDQEIAKNRACFEEVEQNGCGKSDDDYKQFRSCLHNVYGSLTDDCRQMMSKLYGTKS